MKHRVLKSLVAGVLCVCLFVSSLPLGALAAVTQTKGNTAGENQAVLETLQALTGDEEQAAAALEALQEYGLLDEDGNLRQTSKVTLDGKEMILQQVREYLEDCGEEDLQKTVSIDGAEVTLENLQIMIEIEEEIARLRETYFSDEAPKLTSEQETALNSLAAQLQERGITLQNEAAANGNFQFESGVDHTARVSMSDVDPIDVKYITLKGPSSYTTVNFTTDKPAEQDITFTVRTLAGSAKPSTNYEETLTQVRIAKGQSSASVQIPLRRYEFDWTDDLWTGDKVFFVQACDISGALFDNEEHSITKPIRLQYPEAYIEEKGGIPTEISFEASDTGDKYDVWQNNMPFDSRDMYFLRNSVTDIYMDVSGLQLFWDWDESRQESGNGEEPWFSGGGWYPLDDADAHHVYDHEDYKYRRVSALTYADYSLLSGGVALVSKKIGFKYTDTENDPNEKWVAYSKANPTDNHQNLSLYASDLGFEKISEDTKLNTTVEYTLPEDRQQLKEKRLSISNATSFRPSLKTEVFAVGYDVSKTPWLDYVVPDMFEGAPKKFTQAIKVTAKDERGPVVVDVQAPQNTRTDRKYAVGESYPITVTFDSPVKVAGDETLVVNKVVDKDGTVTNPGTTCEIVESSGTVTRTVTFLSYVKPGDGEGVLLNSMDGFTDISGKETESFDDSGDDFPTLTLQGVAESEQPHWAAIADVSVDAEGEDASYTLYAPGATEGTVTVTLDENKNVRSWLTQAGATDKDKVWEQNNAYVLSKVLGFSLDGGETIQPLYIKANQGGTPDLKGDFDLEINSTTETKLYGLELYELNPETGRPYTTGENAPFFGSGVIFGTQPAIFLSDNNVTINYPDFWYELGENERVFADQLKEDFKLGFTVNLDSATWGDETLVTTLGEDGKPVVDQGDPKEYHFAWSSSNPNVATIDKTGKITILTNGTVHFTLTALNGDLMLPDLDENGDPVIGEDGETVLVSSRFEYQTPEILVGIGNSPTLTIPQSLRTTTVRGGQSATVLWSSNLTEKNRDYAKEQKLENWETTATTFTVKVYKQGDWDTTNNKPNANAAAVGEAITVSSSMESVKSSAIIPASYIPYDDDCHEYYFTVSAVDNATKNTLTAWGKIVVQSPPATVTLHRPASLYITDEDGDVNLSWALENFTDDGDFRLTITNNSADNPTPTVFNETGDNGGSHKLTISKVTNGYRDAYTVEAAAKNGSDSTWSYDSFVLYVYDQDVLEKIYVNGEESDGSLTLSNHDQKYITNLAENNSAANQQAVWNTGRDIALTADVSMDPDKPWLEVPDQFAWSAQDTDREGQEDESQTTHATINYRQGALYEDITRNEGRTSYGPTSEFRLSGLTDGETLVKSEHVNTQTVAELMVTVETLKDQLFLFQLTPATTTTLTYKNGAGVQKTVTSMSDGRAAIYEESGIDGDVYLESEGAGATYFGTIYNEDLVSSEKDSTQMELYPVNYMTLRKAAEVPLFLKNEDGTPFEGTVTVHGGVYLNDKYAEEARLDTNEGTGYDGVEGYEITLGSDGAHTFVFDMTQFSTEGRNVKTDPVNAQDNVQFVLQLEPEGCRPLLLRVNGNVNESDAIAAGDRNVTVTNVKTGEGQKPFAAQQTLYYGENKYGYSSDVLGVKGKLGPGDTYPNVELETLTLWWGTEKSEQEELNLVFQDEFRRVPDGQSCQVMDYPFTTIPVTLHSFKLNKDTLKDWLGTLESSRMDMVYYDSNGSEIRREDPSFRIVNMIGVEDVTSSQKLFALMKDTTLKGSMSSGTAKVSVSNALVTAGIKMATTFGLGADNLTMKIVPTADPTVFRGIFLIGLNNMIDDNVSKIDPDTSKVDDLDYMPGREDLTKFMSMGAKGYAQDAQNRMENAQKLLKNSATTKASGNDISYMLKGGFETEIYYDYDASEWKMVVVTGSLDVGGGFGKTWCFNSFCGPVPVTAELGFGIALDVQFAAAVDRTVMMNDYLTQIQLNAFIRAFAGIGFDYAIMALKIGLFGQISFQGAIRVLNAINEEAKVGYNVDFDGEVGIEFLIRFLFISYERILWSIKFDIADGHSTNWDDIQNYWETVQDGKSGNDYQIIQPNEKSRAARSQLLSVNSTTGQALYGSPSTATLEDRSYLDNPRTYGGGMTVLRARANALTEGSSTTLMTNSYPGAEPYVTEDGELMAFLHDNGSDDLEETRASYVENFKFGSEGSEIKQFPDPEATDTQAEGNVEQATGGDSQLRLAGNSSNALAVWSRVTETLEKEPGSAVTSDEQMLMMNSTEIFASVKDDGDWKTTRLTTNSSADMAPVAATNGEKALVAWRAVAAQNSAQLTTFDSYDTIQYKIYDYEDDNWSGPYTLYNGTSGAVKGIEAQMTDTGKMAVAYTIEKGSQESTTQVLAENDGTTSITSDLQTVFAMIEQNEEDNEYVVTKNVQVTDDDDVNENPQLTAVKFPGEEKESFLLGWYSVHDEDGVQKNDIRLAAFTSEGLLRHDFVDSLSVVSSQTAGNITSNFRFSKGAEQLSDLSILWTQPALDVNNAETQDDTQAEGAEITLGDADHDVLMGVRFRVESGKFAGLTAPIQLSEMGTSQTIESFDGWVQTDGSLKAVTLSTEYGVKGIDGKTYQIEEVPGVNEDGTASSGEPTKIAVPNSQANLLLVTGSYSDSISLELPLPDYEALLEGSPSIPVQVGVTNQGTQPITQLTFTVGDGDQNKEFSGLNLQPGESTDLTLDYTVQNSGGKITCPTYSVTAIFNDGTNVTEKGDVEINLNVHDLGISTFQDTEQSNGQRVLQFSLFNNSPAKLEDSGKNVVVGVFSDSSCTVPIDEKYLNFGEGEGTEREYTFTTTELNENKQETTTTETITTKVLSLSGDNLSLIDNGAYLGQLTFDLKGYAKASEDDFLEKGEIRDAGISLYLKVWVEETDNSGKLQELGEVITGNNTQGLTLNSLMKDSEEQVTISGDVTTNAAGNTVVTPTLQNNSLKATASGYLIVDLLDENGNLLDSKQTYMKDESGNVTGWIELGTEEKKEVPSLTFSQKGSSVKYRFGQAQDTSSTQLTGISLTGIPLAFEDDKTDYSVTVDKDLSQTILTLTQAYLGAQIKVNGQLYNGSTQISLPTGTTTLTIEVTSGNQTQTYTVNITRPSGGSSGSQGGTGGATRYPVSLSGEVEHGSVTISPTRATAGQTVTLTPKAEEGYELRKLQVIGPDGGEIALTKKADGTYTFKMPKGSVKVTAVFGCDGTGDCPSKNFTDLGENQWYHDYIDYAVEHGLLEGTSPTTMEPNATLTRAQLAQILYNLEDKPAVTGDVPFEDVPEGQWYYAAILWANQEGVVNGMSPDTFEPGTNISRQDLALMLYRYAGEPETQGSLEKFQDAGKVGNWAKAAITWAVEESIIDGMTPTTLEPTGTATRAQAAAMLQRFLEG